jgi:hypothetical protein
MLNLGMGLKVFIAPGSTDMRKSIRGFSLTITQFLNKDPPTVRSCFCFLQQASKTREDLALRWRGILAGLEQTRSKEAPLA